MAYLETLHDHEVNQAQFSVVFITNVLSCLALGLTAVFFAFNIRYRNFRLIKMSSPNINNIINFNCMLLYLCPILNGIKGMYIYDEKIAGLMCVVIIRRLSFFILLISLLLDSEARMKTWGQKYFVFLITVG